MTGRRGDMAPQARPITVFPITERGFALAKRLAEARPGVVVHPPQKLRRGGLKRLVSAAFDERRAIFFIGACGIAVRSIAPYLRGKEKDPAVVVMDEGAGFVISLLSGHLGGANRLAVELAALYGAVPVITTATDVARLSCAEDIAGRFALRVEDARKIKRVNSAILKGEKILVVDMDAKRRKEAKGAFKGPFSYAARLPEDLEAYAAFVVISPFALDMPVAVKRRALVLRPVEFTIGVGCRRGVREKEVSTAVNTALAEAGVSLLSVGGIATIDIKSDEAGLLVYAANAGLGMKFYSAVELNSKKPPSGRSRIVEQKTGASGVCEPAALLLSGAKRLWLKKRIYGRVTVALARAL